MELTRRAVGIVPILMLCGVQVPQVSAHESESGPNGGPMVEVKGLHLELIAKDADLAVVLSDTAHAPLASKGASGRAVVLEGSTQKILPLLPMDPDRLTAKLDKPLSKGARVVVSAKLASGQELLARFVVK